MLFICSNKILFPLLGLGVSGGSRALSGLTNNRVQSVAAGKFLTEALWEDKVTVDGKEIGLTKKPLATPLKEWREAKLSPELMLVVDHTNQEEAQTLKQLQEQLNELAGDMAGSLQQVYTQNPLLQAFLNRNFAETELKMPLSADVLTNLYKAMVYRSCDDTSNTTFKTRHVASLQLNKTDFLQLVLSKMKNDAVLLLTSVQLDSIDKAPPKPTDLNADHISALLVKTMLGVDKGIIILDKQDEAVLKMFEAEFGRNVSDRCLELETQLLNATVKHEMALQRKTRMEAQQEGSDPQQLKQLRREEEQARLHLDTLKQQGAEPVVTMLRKLASAAEAIRNRKWQEAQTLLKPMVEQGDLMHRALKQVAWQPPISDLEMGFLLSQPFL